MNPVSEDIKDMLEDDTSLGLTFGTDLHIAKEPSTPDNVVTIYDTPSYPPDITLDNSNVYYRSSFQVRVRHLEQDTGMALARNIMESLHARAQETWNGTLYTVIRATGEPAPLGWSEKDRIIIIVNFNCQRR